MILGPTLVVPAGDVREGDYLVGHHLPYENPQVEHVAAVGWKGRSRTERRIRLPLADLTLHKDTLVIVQRRPFAVSPADTTPEGGETE